MFAGAALQFLDPDRSISLLREVVAEKPQLVYARDRLALVLVFKAIDTKGGDSKFADEALDEVRTSAGVLGQTNNPCLASTRLYAHVTKAFLEYVREDQPQAAKKYLEEHARADVDIRVNNLYQARLRSIAEARSRISDLQLNGKGTEIKGVKESLWGTFNAVLEFIDHYEKNSGNNIASNLFGTGAALKRKAYDQALVYLQ